MGTFIALKPFYVRQCSQKDIEMYCCKIHLHARWSINALLELCKKQSIDLGLVHDYYSFFTFNSSDCENDTITHMSWECVSTKKSLCQHANSKWQQLVNALKESSNDKETVKMLHFQMIPYKKKNGQIVERLKPVKEDANITFVINFIQDLLANIVHHRNHLQHFRKVHPPFLETFIDIDFSEI